MNKEIMIAFFPVFIFFLVEGVCYQRHIIEITPKFSIRMVVMTFSKIGFMFAYPAFVSHKLEGLSGNALQGMVLFTIGLTFIEHVLFHKAIFMTESKMSEILNEKLPEPSVERASKLLFELVVKLIVFKFLFSYYPIVAAGMIFIYINRLGVLLENIVYEAVFGKRVRSESN